MKPYTILNEKSLPEAEFELEVEITYETLNKHRVATLKKMSATVSVPGFRTGHVPENILIQKVGEFRVLEESAFTAIETVLPEILTEKKLAIIGEPSIAITKLATGNPLSFKITVSIAPKVELPNYK